VTIRLRRDGVRVVLMDVEGTTTPISFVYDVLFPYARGHLRAFLRDTPFPVILSEAKDLATGGATPESIAERAESLMDQDSKSPGLKALQGLIWKDGYESGELLGDVFPDVPVALGVWGDAGIRSAIYSSGSVLAQRLLFGSTRYGDLTTRIEAHFDTGVGPKREPSSYVNIATQLGCEPRAILFLSDIAAEIEASRRAGCQAALVQRPGNPPEDVAPDVPVIRSFAEITP
jgi:enolase-phosphatase E1